jgi:hypothetical protein
MSGASRWHSRQSTFRQEVGSFPIGGGVGGAQNLGEEGGEDGVGVGGVGVAGDGDGGCRSDAGDVGNVEGVVALASKRDGWGVPDGEGTAFSRDSGVGGE